MCQIFCRLIKLLSKAEVVVLFHIDLTLILNYFFFLFGANFTTIPILCGINSGVLQLITLVFYCWLATQAILWYLKSFQRSKKQSLKCIAVFSWSKSCSTRYAIYYRSVLGKRPCTAFQGVTTAASIQPWNFDPMRAKSANYV